MAGIVALSTLRAPDDVAVLCPYGRRVTYAELSGEATRLGNGFLSLGLQRGDRVAAWMEDTLEYIELYVACALAGLVVVPINSRLTGHEASFLVSDSGARLLVASPALEEAASSLSTALGITFLGNGPTSASPTIADLVRDGSSTAHPMPATNDLYMIGYTSGTTGIPKGAMLTQGSVATLAHMNAGSYRLPIGSVCALTGSMSFVAVVPAHVITHFFVGGTVILLGAWDVPSLLDLIERERVTFTYLPSPLLLEFAQAAAARPETLESLSCVLHSGSKAELGKLRRVADVIGNRLVEGWGMTENSGGLVTATVPEDVKVHGGGTDRLGTVGRAVPDVVVRLVDATGAPAPHDGHTIGELLVASPALMKGYWNRPEATLAAFDGEWFRTGDLGTIDKLGYVTVSERRDDLIVSGGMNVYPAEVEQVILSVPGIVGCAVVGVPHERWGQSVAAAVVRAEGAEVTEADVLAACRERLASFKKPTLVRFVDALPMTASQKISRAAVRKSLGSSA